MPKSLASDFLLCFVCFIDTAFCKCDRYKHVQSANIGVKCVTFVSETFTRYNSNITNVWEVTQLTLAFSCEVVHEKLWKSVNICKSYSKKISGTFFFWTRCTATSHSSSTIHGTDTAVSKRQGEGRNEEKRWQNDKNGRDEGLISHLT